MTKQLVVDISLLDALRYYWMIVVVKKMVETTMRIALSPRVSSIVMSTDRGWGKVTVLDVKTW